MKLSQTDDGWMVLNNKGQPMNDQPFKTKEAAQRLVDRINKARSVYHHARDSRSRAKA